MTFVSVVDNIDGMSVRVMKALSRPDLMLLIDKVKAPLETLFRHKVLDLIQAAGLTWKGTSNCNWEGRFEINRDGMSAPVVVSFPLSVGIDYGSLRRSINAVL